MAGYRKLWWILIAILAITFGLLGRLLQTAEACSDVSTLTLEKQ